MTPEMESFLSGITLADIVWWTIVAGTVFASVKYVFPAIKGLIDFFDDVKGEPARPGVEARPGLMDRLASVESIQKANSRTLDTVRHEVFPNSGKSLRDRIDQTAKAVDEVNEKLDNDNRRIASVENKLDEHITQSIQIFDKFIRD